MPFSHLRRTSSCTSSTYAYTDIVRCFPSSKCRISSLQFNKLKRFFLHINRYLAVLFRHLQAFRDDHLNLKWKFEKELVSNIASSSYVSVCMFLFVFSHVCTFRVCVFARSFVCCAYFCIFVCMFMCSARTVA